MNYYIITLTRKILAQNHEHAQKMFENDLDERGSGALGEITVTGETLSVQKGGEYNGRK